MRRFHQKRQNHHHMLILLQPPGGAKDSNGFAGADRAQDMEESTDNAPPTVIANQLEAFRKEIEAMHKQIHDRVSDP
ncbi:hypothetical protein ACS0TY_010473 [Phlomoides rotata]